uniref:Uncharacterized protein n=1 Tax=Parastrongyloides trichosuri TaxID=131310 RepID=A0A0N4ZZ64_PARTI
MQFFGYIIAAVALVASTQAAPQFGPHGFGGRGSMMGPQMRGGYGGMGGPMGGMRGGMGMGGPTVSKTVITKTVVHG